MALRMLNEGDTGRAGLGGWLMVVCELEEAGIASMIAGCVAGAAVLGVDSQRERVKQLLRYGICDFVVNDLDESLRILKNEVRKRQPVSVCLSVDPEACVSEMLERGVQPELLAGRCVDGGDALQQRGAVRLNADLSAGTLLSWKLRDGSAAWAAGPVLTRVDELAATALDEREETTPWRRRWLQRAPRYMGRRLANERCIRMHGDEAKRLQEALRKDDTLAAQVALSRDGEAVSA